MIEFEKEYFGNEQCVGKYSHQNKVKTLTKTKMLERIQRILVADVYKLLGLIVDVEKLLGLIVAVEQLLGLIVDVEKLLGLIVDVEKLLGLIVDVEKLLGLIVAVEKLLGLIVAVEKLLGLIVDVEKLLGLIVDFEDKWEFPRCYLTLEHVIGEGEFGQVVRAQAFMLNGQEGNSVVAVKMLKPDASGAEYQDLVSEFQLLKEVDHPNVIKLLGVCTQKGPLYVIVEYCELGSLRSFLRSAKLKSRGRSWEDKQRSGGSDANPQAIHFTRTLTFRDLLSFAWQISKGMDYLASLKIVHRDLAARNVLVTEGLKMKISDFGLSRDVYEADAYLKMSKGRMPVKWMAPESLYAQIYTTKSDVWSYGIVLWEVVTLGASPYPGIPPERLFPLLSTGYRMDRPEDCPDELYAIMQKCWKAEPENRPHFSTLREILDHLLQQNTEYLELSEDKYFLSSLEIDDRRAKVSPSYGNVCSLNKCQPDAYVSSNWPGEELGDNECPEMSKLLIPCENDLEVTKRHSYCNDGPKICDRLLVHENLTYV
ncbi:hypothetical protein Btru_071453 [Bulinus truncatus]|nr:hypothetical protein Btru_071453 [Bulinus truncatus]